MLSANHGILEQTGADPVYALNLDPTYSDRVSFPGARALMNGRRTISFWFKPNINITTSTPLGNCMFSSLNAPTRRVYIQFSGGQISFLKDNASGSSTIVSNSNSWTAGTWYHFAGVIDPTTGMKMYIDGTLQTSTNANTEATRGYLNACYISSIQTNNIRYFDGSIHNLQIWDTARTSGEIATDMNTYYGAGTTNLYESYHFTEGSGTTVTGVNGNAGTISTTNGGGTSYINSTVWTTYP